MIADWVQAFFLLLIFFTISDLASPLQKIAAELKRRNDWNEDNEL